MDRRELLQLIAMAGISEPSVVRAQSLQSDVGNSTKYVHSSDGTRIAYEVVGTGPTLVLQHGFSGNRNVWRVTGYVDALLERFRLILIDARGHGESGGPAVPEAYTNERFAGDVAAVVEVECDEPPTFWGYSMGGRIGFACMAYTPNLYRRFIIGAHGSSIFGTTEEDARNTIARAERFEQGLEALNPEQRARLKDANLPALAASSRASIVWEPGLREKLSDFNGPTLYYIGGQDAEWLRSLEAENGGRLIDYLANPTYVEIPGGLNHRETHQRSDLVLPHVFRFLEQT